MADTITTTSIYRHDLEWLKNRQLRAATAKEWPHMADVMHALIAEIRKAEEAGEGA